MKQIISKSDLDNKFQKDGFVILPFLSSEQLTELQNLAAEIVIPDNVYFYSTSFINDINFKKKLSQQIIEIIQPQLQEFFYDYKLLGGNFLFKMPGEPGEMQLHQDWTVTDESQFQSITIWIPLCDTNKKNGTMQCIPGSQVWSDCLRAPSLPVSLSDVYQSLNDHLELFNLTAGEAFIFNHALMHASPPNQSNEVRIALTVGLTHRDARLRMYYQKEKGKVEQFNMPDDMFIHFPEIKPVPKIGVLANTFTYEVPKLTQKEVWGNLYNYRKENFTMKPIFKDSEKQAFFEKNGYIKIPALHQEQVDILLDLHKELGINDEAGHGFYVGMDNNDKQLVSKMMDRIIEVALPSVKEHLHEAQVFTASFVVKDPNPKGVVPPHQDWSFVEDEKEHCSLTCWIPLVDVNMDNGCLGVIPGSNRFFNHVRPSPSPQVPSPLSKHMFALFPYLKLVEMKAGEALLFDNRTIHASPPNITNSPRIAVGMAFTQKEAQIRHYYLKPGTIDTMLKYEIDSAFFRKYDNGTLSKMYDKGAYIEEYQPVEEMKFTFEDISSEEMNRRIVEAGNEMNTALILRMTELFKDEMNPKKVQQAEVSEEPLPLSDFQKSFIYRLRPSNLVSAFKYYVLNKRA